MAKMFQCPSCGKQYPALPTLVERPVRCSGCREIFRLGHDGIAVVIPIPVASPPQPQAPTPEAAQVPSSAPAAATAAEPSPRPQTRAIQRRREALRQSLSAAAAEAAAATAPAIGRRETATPAPEDATASGTTRPRRGHSDRGDPAGFEPLRRAQSGGAGWALPILGLVVAAGLALGLWLLLRPSPVERAIDRFLADVGDGQRAYPDRHRIQLGRTWMRTITGSIEGEIVLNCDEARIGPLRRIPADRIRSFLSTQLGGMVKDDGLAIWIQADRRGDAEALVADFPAPGDREALLAALAEAGIRHLDFAAIPGALHALGLGEIEIYALSVLLAGTAADVHPFSLLEGAQALELHPFSGRDGRLLLNDGVSYATADGQDYWGTVLRVDGQRPSEWRILSIHRGTIEEATRSDRRNPLVRAARAQEARFAMRIGRSGETAGMAEQLR